MIATVSTGVCEQGTMFLGVVRALVLETTLYAAVKHELRTSATAQCRVMYMKTYWLTRYTPIGVVAKDLTPAFVGQFIRALSGIFFGWFSSHFLRFSYLYGMKNQVHYIKINHTKMRNYWVAPKNPP